MSDIEMILPDFSDIKNESQFQKVVVEIGGYYGYTSVYHTKWSVGSDPGFPDLSMFNPEQGGVLFLECKIKKNRPTERQRAWMHAIRQSGNHAYCVHPDWIDLIVDVMRGRYPPPQVGTGDVHPVLLPICFVPEWS